MVKNWFKEKGKAVTNLVGDAWSAIKIESGKWWDKITNAFEDWLGILREKFTDWFDWIWKKLAKLWLRFRRVLAWLPGISAPEQEVDAVTEAAPRPGRSFGAMAGAAAGAGKGAGGGKGGFSLPDSLWEGATGNIFTGLFDWLENIGDMFTDWLENIGDVFTDWLENIEKLFSEWLKKNVQDKQFPGGPLPDYFGKPAPLPYTPPPGSPFAEGKISNTYYINAGGMSAAQLLREMEFLKKTGR